MAALRRLGFGISELGERKLKGAFFLAPFIILISLTPFSPGLESAELISLLWPTAIKERVVPPDGVKGAVDVAKKTEVVQDTTPQLLDVNVIKAFGKVVQRLEAASGLIVHGFGDEAGSPQLSGTDANHSARPNTATQSSQVAKRKTLIHPTTLAFPVRADATDDELAALLEVRPVSPLSTLAHADRLPLSKSYLVRVENCLSTLVLHQLGPFTEVLSALGTAIRSDPRSVMLALTRFAGVMQAQSLSQATTPAAGTGLARPSPGLSADVGGTLNSSANPSPTMLSHSPNGL